MIEPNLATMLAFIVTDAPAGAAELQRELQRAARGSFNRITVDGDQSTSDMVVLLSSRERAPRQPPPRPDCALPCSRSAPSWRATSSATARVPAT